MMKEMISQTAMVHKLDVLSSKYFVDCFVVREEKMVCPAASKGGSEEWARMVSAAFYVARGGDPGRMVSVILIGRNI